jgi:hypothetical protein
MSGFDALQLSSDVWTSILEDLEDTADILSAMLVCHEWKVCLINPRMRWHQSN